MELGLGLRQRFTCGFFHFGDGFCSGALLLVPQRFLELLWEALDRLRQSISEALECGSCRTSQILAEASHFTSEIAFEHLERSLELPVCLAGGGVQGGGGVRALFRQGLR